MVKAQKKIRIPNPHARKDIHINLVKEILKQAEISDYQWDKAWSVRFIFPNLSPADRYPTTEKMLIPWQPQMSVKIAVNIYYNWITPRY